MEHPHSLKGRWREIYADGSRPRIFILSEAHDEPEEIRENILEAQHLLAEENVVLVCAELIYPSDATIRGFVATFKETAPAFVLVDDFEAREQLTREHEADAIRFLDLDISYKEAEREAQKAHDARKDSFHRQRSAAMVKLASEKYRELEEDGDVILYCGHGHASRIEATLTSSLPEGWLDGTYFLHDS